MVVGARMRHDGRWADVCILDASSRGFLISTSNAPPRGTYIEITRGESRYVARVMWQGSDRCGVQTRDRVCVEALLTPREGSASDATFDSSKADRRAVARVRETLDRNAERSVWLGQTIEYASIAGIGAMAAILIVTMLTDAFSTPLARVSAALETARP